MLKIKDNVDLKELEKFGLRPLYDCDINTGKVHIRCIVSEKYSSEYGVLTLVPKVPKKKGLHILNRFISNNNKHTSLYYFSDNTYVDIDLLYDLIKADLVEKVGG